MIDKYNNKCINNISSILLINHNNNGHGHWVVLNISKISCSVEWYDPFGNSSPS